jgi:Glycosyltransferase 61
MSGADTELRRRGSLEVSEPRELLVSYPHRGAHLPDGRLARDTLRLWGRGQGECPDPVPDELAHPDVVRDDDTEVLWGGFYTHHYGHFLSESVARLWPLLPGGELEGMPVVFGTPAPVPFISDWERAFGLRTVQLPFPGTVRFTRIRVPEPAWRMSGWIAPEMRDVHLHARERLEVPDAPASDVLWLSRSRLAPERRVRDEVLCQWLLGDRVRTIHPESMGLAEQVAALEASRSVVGPLGSAFHTLLLARSQPACVYLSPSSVSSSFTAQDALLETGGEFVHVLAEDHMDLEQGWPYRLLVPETLRALRSTLLPDLFDDPRLERLAHPERWSATAATGAPAELGLEAAIAKVLLDPLRTEGRMALGDRFEREGILDCAVEQFGVAADLAEGYAYPALRAARLLSRLGRDDEAAAFAGRVLALEPGSEEARGYAEKAS